MPPTGAEARGSQLATLDRARPPEVDRRPHRRAARRARAVCGVAPVRRRRRLPRTGHAPAWEKLRRVPTELAAEFTKTQADAYQDWVGAREEGDFAAFRPWLERVLDVRLRMAECFAPYDEPVRRPPRRLRRGPAHRGHPRGLRGPPARAHVARRRARRRRAGRAPARAVPDRQAGRALARGRRGDGRDVGLVPARPDRAPVRGRVRARRHPAHDALRRERPELPVHRDARGRPRAVRVRLEPVARPDADVRVLVVVAARVAEPPVGERRRPLAAVLALVLPAGASRRSRTGSATSRWSRSTGP